MPTTPHTNTRQTKNTQKDEEALLYLSRTRADTLMKVDLSGSLLQQSGRTASHRLGHPAATIG